MGSFRPFALSLCDFHMFDPLKQSLKWQRFNADAEVGNGSTNGTPTLMLMEIFLNFLNKKYLTVSKGISNEQSSYLVWSTFLLRIKTLK